MRFEFTSMDGCSRSTATSGSHGGVVLRLGHDGRATMGAFAFVSSAFGPSPGSYRQGQRGFQRQSESIVRGYEGRATARGTGIEVAWRPSGEVCRKIAETFSSGGLQYECVASSPWRMKCEPMEVEVLPETRADEEAPRAVSVLGCSPWPSVRAPEDAQRLASHMVFSEEGVLGLRADTMFHQRWTELRWLSSGDP